LWGHALPLIAIYLYTKFHLNAKSMTVLKLFAGQGTGWTDGQNDDYMLPPLGSNKKRKQ